MFEAFLKVTYTCPPSHPGKTLNVKIYGKGHLPEIEIIEPVVNESSNTSEISFNATLLGTCSCKDVRFKNVGTITCSVILEIADDIHDVFSLVPKNDTIKLLKMWNTEISSSLKHTNLVTIKPEETAAFELQFNPKFDLLFTCALKLHVVQNPYEEINIAVTAYAFDEDITIDGLPAKVVSISPDSSVKPSLMYELDFKSCPVHVFRKKCFRIMNHSKNHTYKFEFANTNVLSLIPAVGHLKPQFSKEILCTMIAREPLVLENEYIDLCVYKITYLDQEQRLLSWDERQSLTVWMSENKEESLEVNSLEYESLDGETLSNEESNMKFKRISSGCEPNVQPESTSKTLIKIVASAVADFCSYSCSASTLAFPDTFAMQVQWFLLIYKTFILPRYSNINYLDNF